MLTVYCRLDNRLAAADDPAAALKDGSAVWIDLLRPSDAEEKLVEDTYGVDVPTETERAMLEFSARFYQENGALVLTATLVTRANDRPESGGVSFILTKTGALITVRAMEPVAFRVGQGRASARIDNAADGGDVLMALLEAVIERLADVLQEVSTRAQKLSESVFSKQHFGAADMRPALAELSTLGTIVTLGRDSLGSLERLFAFAGKRCDAHGLPADQMAALLRDAEQLDRQGDAMQDHLVFLLDGVLGLVAANQNVAIQRLSVFASVFVPSTLIASIFGMNFEAMTWFKAPWGAWVAFLLMFAASGAALAIARWRRWI